MCRVVTVLLALSTLTGSLHAAPWSYDPVMKVASVSNGANSLYVECMHGFLSITASLTLPADVDLPENADTALAVAMDSESLVEAQAFAGPYVSNYGDGLVNISLFTDETLGLVTEIRAQPQSFGLWGGIGATSAATDFAELARFDADGAAATIDTVLAGCQAANGVRPAVAWPASTVSPERWEAGETPEADALLRKARVLIELIRDGQDRDDLYRSDAVALLKEAVALDSDVARLHLARLYDGSDDDTEQAMARELFEELHLKGVAAGSAGLGAILYFGDQPGALMALTVAAAAGDAQSMFLLSEAYREGKGVEADPILARRWLEKAADAGRSIAQATLAGELYAEGEKEAAWRYLEQAVEQGEYTAWPLAGIFFETGAGGAPVDIGKAVEAYQLGSAVFSGNSQYYLAGIYDSAKGFTDAQLAAITLHQALRLGGKEVSTALENGFKDFSKPTRMAFQQLLVRIGDYDGPIDGIIGRKTLATLVERYQR